MATKTRPGPVPPPAASPDDQLTLEWCAADAGVSKETVRRIVVVGGKVPYTRVSPRKVTIRRADWEAYKKSCRSGPAA